MSVKIPAQVPTAPLETQRNEEEHEIKDEASFFGKSNFVLIDSTRQLKKPDQAAASAARAAEHIHVPPCPKDGEC